MSGKKNRTLVELYNMQKENQENMLCLGKYDNFTTKLSYELPSDDIQLCSYHIQQLMSEVGEVLSADKRWKNIRNDKYDKENKAEEIADCFIVLMNIAMFSDISPEELEETIANKIKKVADRI